MSLALACSRVHRPQAAFSPARQALLIGTISLALRQNPSVAAMATNTGYKSDATQSGDNPGVVPESVPTDIKNMVPEILTVRHALCICAFLLLRGDFVSGDDS